MVFTLPLYNGMVRQEEMEVVKILEKRFKNSNLKLNHMLIILHK